MKIILCKVKVIKYVYKLFVFERCYVYWFFVGKMGSNWDRFGMGENFVGIIFWELERSIEKVDFFFI